MDKASRSESSQESESSEESAVSQQDEHLTPLKRLQALKTHGYAIKIDNTEDVNSYYDSTTVMIRKADQQYARDELENALISYLKFVDLFRNKIVHHVNHKDVSLSRRAANQYYLRHAQKRAKEISAKLLQRYEEVAFTNQMEIGRPRRSHKASSGITRATSSRICVSKSRSISHQPPKVGTFDIDTTMLRTVVLPKQLPTVFQIVTQRIRKGSFTIWAALAGRLEDGEYLVTHLIIPPQFGEFLTCCNLARNPCLDYAKNNDLVVLGWIHTHRPASCYLSCTDLHIQWQFQKSLPEAITVMCSPLHTQVEYYNLLRCGMEYIGSCKSTGIHTHQATHPLYTIARHVRVVHDRTFKLLDLQGQREEVH